MRSNRKNSHSRSHDAFLDSRFVWSNIEWVLPGDNAKTKPKRNSSGDARHSRLIRTPSRNTSHISAMQRSLEEAADKDRKEQLYDDDHGNESNAIAERVEYRGNNQYHLPVEEEDLVDYVPSTTQHIVGSICPSVARHNNTDIIPKTRPSRSRSPSPGKAWKVKSPSPSSSSPSHSTLKLGSSKSRIPQSMASPNPSLLWRKEKEKSSVPKKAVDQRGETPQEQARNRSEKRSGILLAIAREPPGPGQYRGNDLKVEEERETPRFSFGFEDRLSHLGNSVPPSLKCGPGMFARKDTIDTPQYSIPKTQRSTDMNLQVVESKSGQDGLLAWRAREETPAAANHLVELDTLGRNNPLATQKENRAKHLSSSGRCWHSRKDPGPGQYTPKIMPSAALPAPSLEPRITHDWMLDRRIQAALSHGTRQVKRTD